MSHTQRLLPFIILVGMVIAVVTTIYAIVFGVVRDAFSGEHLGYIVVVAVGFGVAVAVGGSIGLGLGLLARLPGVFLPLPVALGFGLGMWPVWNTIGIGGNAVMIVVSAVGTVVMTVLMVKVARLEASSVRATRSFADEAAD